MRHAAYVSKSQQGLAPPVHTPVHRRRACYQKTHTPRRDCAQVLQPLGPFASPEADAAYPPTPAGQQVQRELEALNLRRF